jgi:NAD(P)H dehydrogenase (quinone)
MGIIVTGAAGNLGRFVIEGLLQKVPADQITAVDRLAEPAADFTSRGVRYAIADYEAPETFDGVFSPGDRVLLISGSDVGKDRVAQHKAVIDTAKAAGVALLAYTSVVGSLTASLVDDHRGTEQVLLSSGLPYVLLRHMWYTDHYTQQLAPALEHGAVVHAGGAGRIASATRADLAAAAVAVLTGEGHENKTYELAGDSAWTYAEYAAELSRQTGKEIVYKPVSHEEYMAILTSMGLPAPFAATIAEVDTAIAKGELAVTTGDLSRLIGRPTTPIAKAIAAALKG